MGCVSVCVVRECDVRVCMCCVCDVRVCVVCDVCVCVCVWSVCFGVFVRVLCVWGGVCVV